MSASLPFDPDQTVVATWRLRLTGTKPDEKTHWRTKVAYYQATKELLAIDPEPGWRDIVNAVRPKGSSSTFYEVTGRRAKHALIGAFRDARTTDALALALCYQRSSPVAQLIDETKVWSFWPYRLGWIEQCRSTPGICVATATDALRAVVGEWSRREPDVAAALDHAPPACVVEDVVAMNRGRLPALRVHAGLRQTVADAIRAGSDSDADNDTEPPPLGAPPPAVPPPADLLLVDLAERIYALGRERRRLAAAEADAVRDTALVLMADAVSGLG
jgi:hypothetical protein